MSSNSHLVSVSKLYKQHYDNKKRINDDALLIINDIKEHVSKYAPLDGEAYHHHGLNEFINDIRSTDIRSTDI